METQVTQQNFEPSGLITTISSSCSGLQIINKEQIYGLDVYSSGRLKLIIPLCPLYQQGTLSQSQLIPNPSCIEESRVGNKWTVITGFLTSLQQYLTATLNGPDLEVVFILANKGVLLGNSPSPDDSIALIQHRELYQKVALQLASELDFHFLFFSYDDYPIRIPRFVIPESEIPVDITDLRKETSEYKIIESLNRYFVSLGLDVKTINNNDHRRVIHNLLQSIEFNSTFWVIAGYLAFDWMLPEIMSTNGIYISIERLHSLFKISKLTEVLKGLPRVQISV
jgi:hypothetical protein